MARRRTARARFFLSFDFLIVGSPISNLKPGCWDLGPGLVETQDLGLETR